MTQLQLTDNAVKKIQKGFPLLQLEDFGTENVSTSADFVRLVNKKGELIAHGYIAKQNKGMGWVIKTQGETKGTSDYFKQLFQQARVKRAPYFQMEGTNAFRLFNGEGDGFGGLAVDYYNGYALFHLYNAFVFEKRAQILAGFREVFLEVKGVYAKNRFERGADIAESIHLFGEVALSPHLILENGLSYATYLNEGWMTGIFLDQRQVRRKIREKYAKGKAVLNLFSYTGAFSVAALAGGAKETVSVDLAKRSIEKTREQFLVNCLDVDAQKMYAMDVFDYFKYAIRKGLRYDLIVLDPPSFARNGKKTFSVAKDFTKLIEASLEILNPKGVIVASTNAANLSAKQFLAQIDKAFKGKNKRYTLKECERLPDDFSKCANFLESDYLKVYFVEVEK